MEIVTIGQNLHERQKVNKLLFCLYLLLHDKPNQQLNKIHHYSQRHELLISTSFDLRVRVCAHE